MIFINLPPDPIINCSFKNIYTPSDDSYLIIDYLKKNITRDYFDGIKLRLVKKILDLGTGTGIIALFLLNLQAYYANFKAKIYASDILEEAIQCAKSNEKLNNFKGKIKFIHSNLFKSFPDNLKHSFDLIIFNPPYLPSSDLIDKSVTKKKIDYSWNGGKSGNQVFLDFLENVKVYLNFNLKDKCYIYYICSSRTDLDNLKSKIYKKGFKNEILDKKHVFFEDIFLNRIEIKER
ncbi:MAG: HemK2/MTQ2 family protein methyltransferase [Promethearchaeota archaeon]